MSFSYDPSTDVGKIRTELGDTVESRGILPEKTNFSDEELTEFLADEGDHAMRAVAHACEVAHRRWMVVPGTEALGPESHKRSTAEHFRTEAARLRARYGYPAEEASAPVFRPAAVSGAVSVNVNQGIPGSSKVYRS